MIHFRCTTTTHTAVIFCTKYKVSHITPHITPHTVEYFAPNTKYRTLRHTLHHTQQSIALHNTHTNFPKHRGIHNTIASRTNQQISPITVHSTIPIHRLSTVQIQCSTNRTTHRAPHNIPHIPFHITPSSDPLTPLYDL